MMRHSFALGLVLVLSFAASSEGYRLKHTGGHDVAADSYPDMEEPSWEQEEAVEQDVQEEDVADEGENVEDPEASFEEDGLLVGTTGIVKEVGHSDHVNAEAASFMQKESNIRKSAAGPGDDCYPDCVVRCRKWFAQLVGMNQNCWLACGVDPCHSYKDGGRRRTTPSATLTGCNGQIVSWNKIDDTKENCKGSFSIAMADGWGAPESGAPFMVGGGRRRQEWKCGDVNEKVDCGGGNCMKVHTNSRRRFTLECGQCTCISGTVEAIGPGQKCTQHLTEQECEAYATSIGQTWQGNTGHHASEAGCLHWPGYGFEFKSNTDTSIACPGGFECYCKESE